MELFTIGYEGRTLPQLVRLLRDAGVRRLVDVRERPASRKQGFSAVPLFDALRKAGIAYESDRALGNPKELRDEWKNGSRREAKARYRRMLRNGRRTRVETLIALAKIEPVAILCYEHEAEECHRSLIAAEIARLEPGLPVRHL